MDDVYQIMIPRARLFLWLVRVSHQCLFAISRVPIKGDLTSILNDTKSQYKFERNVCPTYYSRQQYPRGRVPTGANEPLLILLLPISKARPNRLTHVEQSRRPPVCSLRETASSWYARASLHMYCGSHHWNWGDPVGSSLRLQQGGITSGADCDGG